MILNKIRIGTSGFSYKDWLGNFYPQFCPSADFLQFYSSQLNTVEIDSTYYRIPSEETVKKWVKVTPEDFTFTAKFPQTVTHEGSIESRIENASVFIRIMNQMGSKLGPLLLQFPYSFKPDQYNILSQLINTLPEKGKFAVELRNKKWLEVEKIFKLLNNKNIAFCLIDHPLMPRLKIITADFVYFRFLGDRQQIENDFSYVRYEKEDELNWWKQTILDFAHQEVNCFGYFNNHFSGHAPTSANKLISLIEKNENMKD